MGSCQSRRLRGWYFQRPNELAPDNAGERIQLSYTHFSFPQQFANTHSVLEKLLTTSLVQNFTKKVFTISGAILLNIGTTDNAWVGSMERATDPKKPIVVDPVEAGATVFHTRSARNVINDFPIVVLRGNAAETLALSGKKSNTCGVYGQYFANAAQEAVI